MLSRKLLEVGWKARERRTLFWFGLSFVLLQVSRGLFWIYGNRSDSDQAEALNHLGIWWRLLGKRLSFPALLYRSVSLHQKALQLNPRSVATLRNLASAFLDLGDLGTAQGYVSLALDALSKDANAERGDLLMHKAEIAICNGDLDIAWELVKDSLDCLFSGKDRVPEKVWYIWYTKSLLLIARIKKPQGELNFARTSAMLAFKMAREHDLPFRRHQAKQLVRLLVEGSDSSDVKISERECAA
ncbi:MAG: hypothetical protein ACOC4Z_00495 [Patescibacteria group bacterium]